MSILLNNLSFKSNKTHLGTINWRHLTSRNIFTFASISSKSIFLIQHWSIVENTSRYNIRTDDYYKSPAKKSKSLWNRTFSLSPSPEDGLSFWQSNNLPIDRDSFNIGRVSPSVTNAPSSRRWNSIIRGKKTRRHARIPLG